MKITILTSALKDSESKISNDNKAVEQMHNLLNYLTRR